VSSRFARDGLLHFPAALPPQCSQFLQAQMARLLASVPAPRPWHYAELHNPWSRAAAYIDSWGFLDLCQSPSLLEAVTTLLGPGLILFDSQLLPDPWSQTETVLTLHSDAHRFAVEPSAGLTALLGLDVGSPSSLSFEPFSGIMADQERPLLSVAIRPGDVVFIHRHLRYRVSVSGAASAPGAYAVRYFPATSHYLRDPTLQQHQELTERYPFINYARMPLWLVRGLDQAGNDFVTGFDTRAGYWTSVAW
jgi:hypothetical protein